MFAHGSKPHVQTQRSIEIARFGDADKTAILTTFIEKCRSRGIEAKSDSMDDPEIKQRAQADWETLALEIGDLPPFEERFALMRDLYVSLPWGGIKKAL